jgi:hypothetical protein
MWDYDYTQSYDEYMQTMMTFSIPDLREMIEPRRNSLARLAEEGKRIIIPFEQVLENPYPLYDFELVYYIHYLVKEKKHQVRSCGTPIGKLICELNNTKVNLKFKKTQQDTVAKDQAYMVVRFFLRNMMTPLVLRNIYSYLPK